MQLLADGSKPRPGAAWTSSGHGGHLRDVRQGQDTGEASSSLQLVPLSWVSGLPLCLSSSPASQRNPWLPPTSETRWELAVRCRILCCGLTLTLIETTSLGLGWANRTQGALPVVVGFPVRRVPIRADLSVQIRTAGCSSQTLPAEAALLFGGHH